MTIDLGPVRSIDAESFGEPGQRTFRLRIIGSASRSASVWLEKEQIGALAMALQQALSQLHHEDEPPAVAGPKFPSAADHDFRASHMGIGFDQADRSIVLQMHELGLEEGDQPTLRVRATLDQCASLLRQLEEIIASGRPLCPLCRVPMDPSGHVCVRSNGHSQEPVPEEDSGEES